MKNGDQPAAPFHPKMPHDNESDNGYSGLTKREYFAAIAMQGVLSNRTLTECVRGNSWQPVPSEISKLSIECADALLSELEKPTDK